MKTRTILIAILLAALMGCASTPMTKPSSRALNDVPSDQSQVMFMRSSFVGSLISASIYDVTNDDPRFIGIIENGNRIAYHTEPGHRVFMVVSEAADFMEADLLPGKTYYSIITPRMGAWKARFSIWPIRTDGTGEYHTDSSDFRKWLSETTLVEQTPEALRWYEQNKSSVKDKQLKYWSTWQQKSAEDLAKRTLRPDDGK